MDYTHVLAFLAPYLPAVGVWLASMFQRWLDAKYYPSKPTVRLVAGETYRIGEDGQPYRLDPSANPFAKPKEPA